MADVLIIVIIILGGFVAYGVWFYKSFEKVRYGMSYEQVLSIVGEPKNETITGDIVTCLYSVQVLRGLRLTRVVVFKDNQVISILKGC